ncbi:MAG: MBL fold metallo-hydrolase [Candidatus Kerfeldbacteria bacterium]|nr:MBL fold metallo-hydrolase [Candidatus Kerfeldbacteria bacterium]
MKITFYGAAGGVTGSKHLVEIGKNRVLLDCGSFQGRRQITRELNSELPFDPSTITAVVLTHGHLDHCGLLPLLVKNGYKGNIFSTEATRDISQWILMDSAHIQLADQEYMLRHKIKGHELAEPLYTAEDVAATMSRFANVPYVDKNNDWFAINNNLKIKLYNAGHILGSAAVVLAGYENGQEIKLAYSGDLGRKGTPLIDDPDYIQDEISLLLMESTYGDRTHEPIDKAVEILKNVIKSTLANKGKIIVPSFALGRTQELVYLLHQISDRGGLGNMPIYVDSPLASEITEVFRKHREIYDRETWIDFEQFGEVPMSFKNLHFVSSVDESKSLNTLPGPFMIISSSGMCEAGRIVHHLINNISNAKNTILITGFQAQHTAGRRLVEGVKKIKLFGKEYGIKAQVVVLNEFSAHADEPALIDYASHIKGLKEIFLVHGEPTQASALSLALNKTLPGVKIAIPQMHETVEIN